MHTPFYRLHDYERIVLLEEQLFNIGTKCLYLCGDRFLVHVTFFAFKERVDLYQGTQLVFLNVNIAAILVITN